MIELLAERNEELQMTLVFEYNKVKDGEKRCKERPFITAPMAMRMRTE